MAKFWTKNCSSCSSRDGNGGQRKSDNENVDVGDYLSEDPNDAWMRMEKEQIFQVPFMSTNEKPSNCTRIVCISDTHGKHREIQLPPGDVLIHAGDFTKSGEVGTIRDLSMYFQESGFGQIICIAGNHDMTLHPEYYEKNWRRFHRSGKFDCETASAALQHCNYLEDSSCMLRGGIEVYGSPWSPDFYSWAFNLQRGKEIDRIWAEIPETTDVLISHGPPLGRGDMTCFNGRAGCHDLLMAIQQRVKPRVNVFGHIHEGFGTSFDGETLYVNASSLNVRCQAVNRPIVIDVPHDSGQPARVVPPKCTHGQKGLPNLSRRCGFEQFADLLESSDFDTVSFDLLDPFAFEHLIAQLHIERHKEHCSQLQMVLSHVYATSFPSNNI